MSNVRVPQGFWVTLAVVFTILFLLLLLKGLFLAAIVAGACAVWTGLEASGRGAFTGREKTKPVS
jgi:hypothetical protein